MVGANLYNVTLAGASFEGAIFSSKARDMEAGATGLAIRETSLLNVRGLSADQIDDMFGVRSGIGMVELPEGFSYPEHWHDAEGTTEQEVDIRFEAALNEWRMIRLKG